MYNSAKTFQDITKNTNPDIGVILGTYPIDVRKFNSKLYKLLKSL